MASWSPPTGGSGRRSGGTGNHRGPGAVAVPGRCGRRLWAADAGDEPFAGMDALSMAFQLLRSVDGWLWVVAIVGLARSWVERRQRSAARLALDRPDRSACCVAWAPAPTTRCCRSTCSTRRLSWLVGGQYCLIALASLAATLLLYGLGIAAARSLGSCSASSNLPAMTVDRPHSAHQGGQTSVTGGAGREPWAAGHA